MGIILQTIPGKKKTKNKDYAAYWNVNRETPVLPNSIQRKGLFICTGGMATRSRKA
jgi:hypothetical protein